MLAVYRAGEVVQSACFQYRFHFLRLHKARGAVCAVRQNVKAAFVVYRMIAGQPVKASSRQQTRQNEQCGGESKSGERERRNQIAERVHHPDACDIAFHVEGLPDTEPHRVYDHAVKVPAHTAEDGIQPPVCAVLGFPTLQTLIQTFFQFGNPFRQRCHRSAPISRIQSACSSITATWKNGGGKICVRNRF